VPRSALTLTALTGIAEIAPQQPLAEVIVAALRANELTPRAHDVIAVCQKIVSKSEDRYVELAQVAPSARAHELAAVCDKDARLVELVLRESSAVLRCVKDVLIVRHRLGFVVANAGIDQSNIEGAAERALLLPEDPDHSAAQLRAALEQRFGTRLGVIITDSFGRAWRLGVCGTCIGCAGIVALRDMRGHPDRFGRALRVTQIAVADEIAAAAALVMGEADEGKPVVLVSGVPAECFAENTAATQLVRALKEDLFQ
jgi:coenzyme F420-0:L-glutamate ligase / coenzyme F420-1:gamma-L-glutamate ligase